MDKFEDFDALNDDFYQFEKCWKKATKAEIVEFAQVIIEGLRKREEEYQELRHATQNYDDLLRARDELQKRLNYTESNLQEYVTANHSLRGRYETLGITLKGFEDRERQLREFHTHLHTLLRDVATALPSVQDFVMKQVAKILLEGPDSLKPSSYRVTLFDCRGDGVRNPRIFCIKTVREMLNTGLKEAKDLTDPAYENPPRPVVLAQGLDYDTARLWQTRLTEAGTAKFAVTRE